MNLHFAVVNYIKSALNGIQFVFNYICGYVDTAKTYNGHKRPERIKYGTNKTINVFQHFGDATKQIFIKFVFNERVNTLYQRKYENHKTPNYS